MVKAIGPEEMDMSKQQVMELAAVMSAIKVMAPMTKGQRKLLDR